MASRCLLLCLLFTKPVSLLPFPCSYPAQATPVQAGKAVGAIQTTPFLRIRAEQRGPTTPQQQADPLFGNWLDV